MVGGGEFDIREFHRKSGLSFCFTFFFRHNSLTVTDKVNGDRNIRPSLGCTFNSFK